MINIDIISQDYAFYFLDFLGELILIFFNSSHHICSALMNVFCTWFPVCETPSPPQMFDVLSHPFPSSSYLYVNSSALPYYLLFRSCNCDTPPPSLFYICILFSGSRVHQVSIISSSKIFNPIQYQPLGYGVCGIWGAKHP